MRRLAPLVALGLAFAPACAPDETTGTAAEKVLVDDDGDGWALPLDCDDVSAAIHPGAAERCDLVDEDCDGTTDDHPSDGLSAWLDLDRDGWGDPATADLWCGDTEADRRPWVSNALDCDDSDALVHPGAVERCDSPADEDCDGTNNDPAAIGCVPWYEDGDGDGVGLELSACLCTSEDAWSAPTAGDCDDADPATTPPCEMRGVRTLGDAEVVVIGASAGDRAGGEVSGAGDTDGDGWLDLLVGAPNDTRRPAWWLVRGPLGADADLGAPSAVFEDHELGTASSISMSGGVDLTGDGADDLVLAAYGRSDTSSRWTGIAYVVSGPVADTVDLADAQATFEGLGTTNPFDLRVATLPDADGDGIGDLLIGGRWTDAAWLLPGPLSGRLDGVAAALTLSGNAVDLGASVASAGDVDGDGLTDLLVGATGGGAARSGAAWLVAGGTTGTITEDAATAMLVGGAPNQSIGQTVAGAGDVNADGYADVAVGGPATVGDLPQAGSVWLVLGPVAGTVPLADAEARMDGVAASDQAFFVSAAGDIDGDGFADVLVGAPGNDTGASDAGAAALYFGPLSGSLRTVDAGLRLYGGAPGDAAGAGLAGVGDLDRDGYDDLLVGVPGLDLGGVDAGGAVVLHGGPR